LTFASNNKRAFRPLRLPPLYHPSFASCIWTPRGLIVSPLACLEIEIVYQLAQVLPRNLKPCPHEEANRSKPKTTRLASHYTRLCTTGSSKAVTRLRPWTENNHLISVTAATSPTPSTLLPHFIEPVIRNIHNGVAEPDRRALPNCGLDRRAEGSCGLFGSWLGLLGKLTFNLAR